MSTVNTQHEVNKDQIIYEFLQSAALQQIQAGMAVAVGLNTSNEGMKYFNLTVQELAAPIMSAATKEEPAMMQFTFAD